MQQRFTQRDLELAVAQLSMLQFFPASEAAQSAVMVLLAKMCPSKQALIWLVDTMINRVGKWHGPTELRGVLASRYAPADGIDGTCYITAGFTPDDAEYRQIEAQEERKRLGTPQAAAELPAVQKLLEGKKWLQ